MQTLDLRCGLRTVLLLLLALLPMAPSGARLAAQNAGDASFRRELAASLQRVATGLQRGRLALQGAAVSDGRAHAPFGRRTLAIRKGENLTCRQALLRLFQHVPVHAADMRVLDATLRIAALGLADSNARPELAQARNDARSALATVTSGKAIDRLMRAGRGEEDIVRRASDLGLRLAALLTLGDLPVPVARIVLERQLRDDERLVRVAAAEGLLRCGKRASIVPLTDALAAESDPLVAQLLVLAMHAALVKAGKDVAADVGLRALTTSLDVLQRHDWRTDLAVIDLAIALRSTTSIPRMIDLLDATADRGDEAGMGLLRDRAHAALKQLTGAAFPPDAAVWRKFWEDVRSTFEMPPPDAGRRNAGATSTGFFGIPVRGRRVLFLIDVSGSMETMHLPLPRGQQTQTREPRPASRLTWAKRELMNAVAGLPADARFDVVIFSSDTGRWRGEMVPATDRVRADLRRSVERLSAGGGTNIWGALESALELRSLAWGSAEPPTVDEVFLLSDGAPSSGELTETGQILLAVEEMNRLRRIRLHTIYMGPADSEFMKSLAEQNQGTYVRTGK